jgi:hypothetical protein
MEDITQRAIIKDHDLTQVGLYRAQILDICPISECAMLPVVPPRKVLSLLLQPINDRICILLDRSSKYN